MPRLRELAAPYRWPLFVVLAGALVLLLTETVDPMYSGHARTIGSLLVLAGVGAVIYRYIQSRPPGED